MTGLNEHAAAQAHSDAGAKIVSDHTPRVAGLAWFLNQRLRIQFLITAVTLFLIYAVVAGVLHVTGLRSARAPEFQRVTCDPTAGSREERVRCKIQHEDAATKAHDAGLAKLRSWAAEHEAEKAALVKERRRQHSPVAKRELDEQLRAIASGQRPIRDEHEATRVKFELTALLLKFLQGIDHPMAAVEYDYHAGNVRPVLSRTDADHDPPTARSFPQADRTCSSFMPINLVPRCAEAVIESVPHASFTRAVRWLGDILYAVDQSRRTRTGESK